MGLLNRLFRREPQPPSRDEFADLVIRELEQRGHGEGFWYEPEDFRVRREGMFVVNLHNAYREYCAVPAKERGLVLDRYLSVSTTSAPIKYSDARPGLMPVVRSRAHLELLMLGTHIEFGVEMGPVPYRPLGDHLAVGLARDSEHAIAQVLAAQIEEWGVSLEQALADAESNLRAKSQEDWVLAAPGVFLSPWADTYDASRLILTDLVNRLGVKGDPVALSPNRVTTIITGAADPAGLAIMLDLARHALEDDRPVSVAPLRLSGHEWHTWHPDSEHPELNGFAELRMREMGEEYEQQQGLLQQLEPSRFVAGWSGIETKDGRRFSVATWTDGVTTLLPRVDRVVFVSKDGEPERSIEGAAWARVQEMLGDRLQRTEHWPARWETKGYPTAEELEALVPATP